jgi:hypothetical protein
MQESRLVDRLTSNFRHLRGLPEAEQASVLQHWNDILSLVIANARAELPEPDRTDPVWRLLAPVVPSPSAEQQEAASDRVVQHIAAQWRVFGPRDEHALRQVSERAKLPEVAIKLDAVRVGLVLALEGSYARQKVRIGRAWLRDYGGRRLLIEAGRYRDVDSEEAGTWEAPPPPFAICAPATLPLVHFEAWVRHTTIKEATAWLVDRAKDATRERPRRPGVPGPKRPRNRVEFLSLDQLMLDTAVQLDAVAAIGQPEADRWAELLETVTPRQREMLERLNALMKHGLALAEAKQVVATVMNVGVGAIDTAFTRIRARYPVDGSQAGPL